MMIPKKWIEELKKAVEEHKKIEVDIKPVEDVESPEQWFVRQIWENITFPCPKCENGSIQRVMIAERAWRWTCNECQRDFGYDSPEPIGIA